MSRQLELRHVKCPFSVIGTRTIRSNYNVVVALHAAENACTFKITLRSAKYEQFQFVTLIPNSLASLKFLKTNCGVLESVRLEVEGLAGISYKSSTEIYALEEKHMVHIQTDKAFYKPGDLVQFRVLILDGHARPCHLEQRTTIAIHDGEENLLKQWTDIQVKNGVFSDKYQLSEQPVLGKWQIKVTTKKYMCIVKVFEVDEYILPKFSVQIETAKDVALSDGIIKVTVRSKYTYGKNVKGKAKITLSRADFSQCNIRHSALAEKTIDVDGKGEVEFDLAEVLKIQVNLEIATELEVTAIMEEELTGNKQESSAIVNLHVFRYKINAFNTKFVCNFGKPWTANVAVKNMSDAPVFDIKNPVTLSIEKLQDSNRSHVMKAAFLNDRGIATFEHTFLAGIECEYLIRAAYQDCSVTLGTLKTEPKKQYSEDFLKVKLLTENVRLGDNIEILITSCEKIPYFFYTLVGRDEILKSEKISLAQNKKEHIIDFTATFDMMPHAFLLVHFSFGNKLHFAEQKISVERELQNKISIKAPAESKPSKKIAFDIETAKDSYVGLLGVDQSVLLLRTNDDLQSDFIFDNLSSCSLDKENFRYLAEPNLSALSGLIVIGNIWPSEPRVVLRFRGGGCLHQQSPPVFRKRFPETWIFEDIERTKQNKTRLWKKVPDTITSWVITGFALHPDFGFAVTKQPTWVKAFRPFFIDTNLPYSIKRGETVSVPVVVFNYLDQELVAEITFDNADNEFDFAETGGGQSKRVKSLKVAANNGANISFKICPKTVGYITLKITAISALAGDAIHKKLKVEAEGITIYKNHDYYLEGSSHKYKTFVELDVPKGVIVGSEFIEVSLMGNLLDSTLTNMDNLVRMPSGCGEQNMINFVPNILVLWYLESTNFVVPSIKGKAKRFLEIGYQRQLTYKHNDGSFSAFGKYDRSGSTWLTAYVVRSFHQAKKYIDISTKILEAGLNFLVKTQAANGSFKEVGYVFDVAHMNDLGLTAFVLLAFLENHEATHKHKDAIDRGFRYLQKNVRSSEDLYALSIALYTLQKRKSSVVRDFRTKLEASARIDGDCKWWTRDVSDNNHPQCLYPNIHDVEVTGYILMTLLDMNDSVTPIAKWLISQRNSNGGFSSTQGTVVGLCALIEFAKKCELENLDMSVLIDTGSKSVARKMSVSHDNAMVLQKIGLPKQTREIIFQSQGTGTAIFQISYNYNILERELKPGFKLSSKVKVKKNLFLDVSAEFTPALGEQSSNMVILEVDMPSGFKALKEHFETMKKNKIIKRLETKFDDTVVMVYFESLKMSQPQTISIEAEPTHDVSGRKPSAITIYDYYDTQKRAYDFYQI